MSFWKIDILTIAIYMDVIDVQLDLWIAICPEVGNFNSWKIAQRKSVVSTCWILVVLDGSPSTWI